MKDFKIFESVVFFCSSICLNIANDIVGKNKEVLFTQKSHGVHKANKVGIYKLIYSFSFLLRFSIIDLGFFSLLIAISKSSACSTLRCYKKLFSNQRLMSLNYLYQVMRENLLKEIVQKA